jgi:hypothetical protein
LQAEVCVNAVSLVAEIGDLSRFEHPRKLMGYLGLVPSERSSGERVSRGSITKTGNAHARRLLTEATWNYRFSARISRRAQIRQEDLSEHVRALGWEAQLRLTKRFAALKGRGVQINKVCVAVARELTGFIWAIGRMAQQQAAASRAPLTAAHLSPPPFPASGKGSPTTTVKGARRSIRRCEPGNERATLDAPTPGSAKSNRESRARQARDESMSCW